MTEATTNNPTPDKAQDFGGFTAEKGAQSLESQFNVEKDVKNRSFHKQIEEERNLPYDQTILSNSSMGISNKFFDSLINYHDDRENKARRQKPPTHETEFAKIVSPKKRPFRDSSTYQAAGLIHNYNYSPSISTSSSTSSQLNVPPPYPTPRRDEELGKQSVNPSTQSQHANFNSTEGSFLFEHNRSGSYCCYVNADESDESIHEPEMIRIRETSSGGNLVEPQDFHIKEEECSLQPLTGGLSYPFLNFNDQNLITNQALKQMQYAVPSLSKSSLKTSASAHYINSKPSTSSSYSPSQQSFPYSLPGNTSLGQSQQIKLLSSQHYGLNQLELHSGENKDCCSITASNEISLEVPSRGEPPPYYSQHQVYLTNQPIVNNQIPVQSSMSSSSQPFQIPASSSSLIPSIPSPMSENSNLKSSQFSPSTVTVCQRPHPPNVFCRICQNVRRSHRQNAAALVRRANSSGCQHNRRSAPSPASSSDSLDDAPSILERLKKEWELGILGGPPTPKSVKANCKVDRSKTLPPHALGLKSLANFNNSSLQHKEDLKSNILDDYKAGVKRMEEGNEKANKEVFSNTLSVCSGTKTGDEMDVKKDVAHLDRALNRLSMKRNTSISTPRYSLKSFTNEEHESLLLEPTDNKYPNENVNKQSIVLDNENFSQFTKFPNVPDSHSPNQILNMKASTVKQVNLKNYEKNCQNIELIILEDSDLKIKSDSMDLGSEIQGAT